MHDTFILSYMEATNEHGAKDPNFVNKTGEIKTDEKGIYFVWLFCCKVAHKVMRYRQMNWAWSEDPLKSQLEIKKQCL